MSRLTTIGWGHDQFRVGPWNADRAVAYVALGPRVLKPTEDGVRKVVQALASQGYRGVTTAALRPAEVPAFLAAGFTEREHLVILRHDLAELLPPPTDAIAQLRRGRGRDRDRVLQIDADAFEPSWQLDADGLAEAMRATPSARYRVAELGRPVGYAVCGRAAGSGYLQRLAVDPACQGHGIGHLLVADALGWSRRRGCHSVLVNTQDRNERAISLYLRLGFVYEPQDLVVLERRIP